MENESQEMTEEEIALIAARDAALKPEADRLAAVASDLYMEEKKARAAWLKVERRAFAAKREADAVMRQWESVEWTRKRGLPPLRYLPKFWSYLPKP